MAEGQTFDIPEAGFKWFKDKMEKLGKRAERLVGEKLFLTVVGFHRDEDKNSKFFNHKIMEVFVAFPEPKLNGWEFVARIDHANEVGNIVRTVGDVNLPEMYRHRGPECDHCEKNRRRRDSFIVRNVETGEFKQVGTSCLKDFTGHGDAAKWAKLAELIASIGEFSRNSWNTGFQGPLADLRWYDTEEFCQAAAESVLRRGWVSRRASEERGIVSTREDAWAWYNSFENISNDAKALAEAALEWARGLDSKPQLTDWEHNCYVVANADAMEARSAGLAASIVGVYYNNNRPNREAKGVSVHQGTVGDKIEREVVLKVVAPGADSMFVRHVFEDDSGNTYVWFASSANYRQHLGQKVKIKGTVKNHTEFRGVKQTLINRVKVVAGGTCE